MGFNWHQFASLPWFYRFAGRMAPWLSALAVLLLGYGIVGGLLIAPPDYQQGDVFRIIYIHVPASFLALAGYYTMAICGAIGLIWKMK
ncbi:MAG: heme ABC transporter permease, partial [Gammaproteobacteria bacterium]|nr:heme ABC transporter permease [Gammaproteobacteria bacterium]